MPFRFSILYQVLSVKGKFIQNTEYRIQNTKQRKSPGFSLIEILIALFVIVALVTILFSSSGTLFATRDSKLQTVAATIASKEVENLRNIAFTSLPAAGTNLSCTVTPRDPDLDKLKGNGPGGKGECHLDVSNYDAPASPTQIKQITVKIDWKTDNGATQNLKMDTLIYENGL